MKELLQALASAIAAMPDPKKNAKNDHFRNRYADLGAVLECLERPLQDNGLVVTQTMDIAGERPTLVTTLWHVETGQSLASTAVLPTDKPGPQALGSSITYMRRYALKALFGMQDVDDDGETSQGRGKFGAKASPAPAPEPASKPAVKKGPAPYDSLDAAKGAIENAKTIEGLRQIGLRIAASGFTGGDRDELRHSHATRKAELEDAAESAAIRDEAAGGDS